MRIAVFIMALLGAVGCIGDDMGESDLKVGDSLPDFEVVMSDGEIMTDEDLEGSVSVVMFFNTSCEDCRKELHVMQRIYDEYIHESVVFAFVSREEGHDKIEDYWRKNGLKMPFSAQNDRAVYEKFAGTGIPRIYVSDRDGIIRNIFTDNPVPEYSELKSAIEKLSIR